MKKRELPKNIEYSDLDKIEGKQKVFRSHIEERYKELRTKELRNRLTIKEQTEITELMNILSQNTNNKY